MELQVVDRHQETRDIVSFTLARTDSGRLPAWAPGAHIDVMLPTGLIRQYSLNGPLDCPEWRISVLRERDSRGGSAFLHQAVKAGDRLQVSAPRNNFRLEHARHYVFVAGGIGITPLLPMIEQVAREDSSWELHYGGRSRAAMAFLTYLENHGDRVRAYPKDSRGRPPINQIAAIAGQRPGTAVYGCGPAPLLDALRDSLTRWPRVPLHTERFQPAESRSGACRPVTVRLRSSGAVIRVPPDRSILECLEDSGVEILSSCRSGTCGTCLTGVLDGQPDHRDSVLSDDERESGDWIILCVSRARSAHLELDL
jgi:ferredoxin-NADP reductase